MKIQTILITAFALSFPLAIAQEDGALPPEPRTMTPASSLRDVQDGATGSVGQFIMPPEGEEAAPDPFGESNGADPFKDDDSPSPRERVSPPPAPSSGGIALDPNPFEVTFAASHESLSFCYEEFSLPLEVMIDLQQKQLGDAGLHEHIRKNLKSDSEKDGMRRETFVILRAKSGFPTSAKNKATVVSPDSKTSSQVGYDLQVFYDEPAGMSLRFSSTNTSITGYTKEIREGKEMDKPLINEERIEATVTLSLNTPYLVGTMNRVGSNQGSGSGPRVILGFVTASPVK